MEDSIMRCDICRRSPSERLHFHCTICARNAVYESRIRIAQMLLQNEAASTAVESKIGTKKAPAGPSESPSDKKSHETSTVWTLQRINTEQAISAEKTEQTLTHVKALQDQTETMRAEIARRKAKISQRKKDLKSSREELAVREATALEPVERGIRRMEHRWDAMHAKTLESRVFLCREAAHLYGLQRRKTKKEMVGGYAYFIGGMPIPDLRELDGASPIQVTTSITHLAHLVHLVSHYLSLRLPAEITLAHRDYPLPTVFPPSASYSLREVPYPGSTPSHSSNNSPSTSHTLDQRASLRPRPLHLTRKLSMLAKEDAVAYGIFVEAVTLLAWDIAWVCETQGFPIGTTSWEDVCAMGKNLWQLLVAEPALPLSRPNLTPKSGLVPARDLPSRPAPQRHLSTAENPTPIPVQLGHFSHGTAHSFLAAAEGNEYMRGWRLQSSAKVIDKVKAMLLSERTGAEWEILNGNEWEEEAVLGLTGRDGNGPVKVAEDGEGERGRAEGAEEKLGSADGTGGEEGKARGTSGWTKLKSRATA